MSDKLHKNYKTASYLVFAMLLLDPIEFFFSHPSWSSADELVFEALGLVFIAFTAYAIRRGVNWVKYILLVICLFGAAGIVLALNTSATSGISVGIASVQVIMLVSAVVLLFRIPESNDRALDSDI